MRARSTFTTIVWLLAALGAGAGSALAQPAKASKPNILVIWGDDVGIHNISAYSLGVMGYKTPHIDRLAREGALFTDFCAQQKLHRRTRIVEKLEQGYKANGRSFKVHADGYDYLPFLKGEVKKAPREEIFYFGQGGELNALRWNDWKVHFAVLQGNIVNGVRAVTSWPTIVNLRADPYEKGPLEAQMYMRWYADNLWLFVPVQQKLQEFLATLPEYPFQEGSSLNAAGINYQTLKARAALERLQELQKLPAPNR